MTRCKDRPLNFVEEHASMLTHRALIEAFASVSAIPLADLRAAK